MVVHPHPLGTTGSNGSNGNTSSTSSSTTSGDYVLAYNPDVMNRPDSDLDHNNNNSNNKKKNTSTNSNTCSSTTVGNYYAATVSNHYVEEPSLQSSTSPLSSGTTCYYEVEFKRRRRSIFVGSEGSHAIGEYVQVEADRGLDLGHVVRVSMDLTTFRDSVYYTYGDASLGEQQQRRTVLSTPIKRVLRTATQEEINHLNEKYEEEKQVLEICRAKIRQRLLPMSVIDAEFQFDRHKLTFFFEAER
jgi:hypothetical protein